VVGTSDVDLATLIGELGNSDWVRRGREYLDNTNGNCPFCQQALPAGFQEQLAHYFDESFERATKEIDSLHEEYRSAAESLFTSLDLKEIDDASLQFLDDGVLKAKVDVLRSNVDENLRKIAAKQSEPSRKFQLTDSSSRSSEIADMLTSANEKIRLHNETVANLERERSKLRGDVWRYLLDQELGDELRRYHAERSGIEKAIASLETQIEAKRRERNSKKEQLRELERETTSVQPTVDAINDILDSFGFQNFSLDRIEDSPSYRLIRSDGSDARTTLSEGERSFVTFLYFYHRLLGSTSETGTVEDRIVVFDDPVSSLDSDILFVVSTLIRKMCDEVAGDSSHIKQVFVLTHNVYFHRHVTFRNENRPGSPTYWIVRKGEEGSRVSRYEWNPVRSSYELLWSELTEQRHSNFAVQNSMRRILEHYFSHLGGQSLSDLPAQFQGSDRMVCSSLISWMHAGSHSINDDLFVYAEDASVEAYLRVFRSIFDRTGHLPHYRMMMARVGGHISVKEGPPAGKVTPQSE